MSDHRSHGWGRLLVGLAWAGALLGLWMWGTGISDGQGLAAPATGDVAAVGRPAGTQLPPAHAPLAPARPERVEIDSVGIRAPVVERGLDATGAVDPPPYATPGVVGWYGGSPQPGAVGTALFAGHVDTESRPAVFYRLAQVKPGERVRVERADGSVAEFTVEAVEVFTQERFAPQRVYGPRDPKRAELRLITCGGRYDRERHTYTANVVVSAYLTGARPASRTA
jgi:sortase (surface protein transpeptidase)